MTYGLKIKNSSDRTLLDTEQGGSFLACGQHGTAIASVGAGAQNAFPVSGYSGGNLIIARPGLYVPNTSYRDGHRISRQSNGSWGRSSNGMPNASEGGVVWRELLAQSSSGITPSDYGLIIYDGEGTSSSNILFSASDLNVTAELMATGKFTGTNIKINPDNGAISQYYQSFYMDPNLDMSRYYVMVNGTASNHYNGNTRRQISCEFNYDDNEIRMINYSKPTGRGTASVDASPISYEKDWAIFYVRNGEHTINTDGTW